MTERPDKMLLKCQFLTTLICMCSIILIEQSRMIPGSEPNRLQLWVAPLAGKLDRLVWVLRFQLIRRVRPLIS